MPASPTIADLARDLAALREAVLLLGDRVASPPAAAVTLDPWSLSPEELLRDGALTLPEAVAFSGIGETELKSLVAAGTVPSFKRGRIRLIPRRALVLYEARVYDAHRRSSG